MDDNEIKIPQPNKITGHFYKKMTYQEIELEGMAWSISKDIETGKRVNSGTVMFSSNFSAFDWDRIEIYAVYQNGTKAHLSFKDVLPVVYDIVKHEYSFVAKEFKQTITKEDEDNA